MAHKEVKILNRWHRSSHNFREATDGNEEIFSATFPSSREATEIRAAGAAAPSLFPRSSPGHLGLAARARTLHALQIAADHPTGALHAPPLRSAPPPPPPPAPPPPPLRRRACLPRPGPGAGAAPVPDRVDRGAAGLCMSGHRRRLALPRLPRPLRAPGPPRLPRRRRPVPPFPPSRRTLPHLPRHRVPSSPARPRAPLAGSAPDPCFDFLVKRLPGTPSARLCDLRPGDLVHVGASVVGRGFEVARVADARDLLVFATGSGISPIRSLIESGFVENNKTSLSLFYGVRNLQRMAYKERFDDWESRGIKVVPVLSRPDSQWTGERGYVQNVFSRMKNIVNPSSVGAILCGHKQMTEEITRVLVADGLSKERILTNF
ncbi:hypothetical protein U9M48_020545 [Paspalum notatum var. saurae]|uniref:Oxidoreductase FAD/NAD(P)-binding domain-containing protein n=1 Tax=Paspalum notatum var. saurae TaxID=547442 RepID=A0AAQ3WSC8_PASNO